VAVTRSVSRLPKSLLCTAKAPLAGPVGALC